MLMPFLLVGAILLHAALVLGCIVLAGRMAGSPTTEPTWWWWVSMWGVILLFVPGAEFYVLASGIVALHRRKRAERAKQIEQDYEEVVKLIGTDV